MLLRGLQGLEDLFPGYLQKLREAGAVPVDCLGDLTMVSYTCWLPCLPQAVCKFHGHA